MTGTGRSTGTLLFVGVLVVAGVISTGNEASAEQILESRAQSLCSYELDQYGQLTDADCFLEDQDFVAAMAADSHEDALFYSDLYTRKIFRKETERQVPETVLYGVGNILGLAVDWLARNLYWTDVTLHHVCVSRYDGSRRAILLRDDVIEPRAITLDPFDGFLFWSQFKDSGDGRVYRSDLDGGSRAAIVREDFVSPGGLAIDVVEKRLYFADTGTNKIESVTYDGQDRREIYARDGADFFDITLSGDFLYATVWRSLDDDGEVKVLRAKGQGAGTVVQTLTHSGQALGITTLGEDEQPEEINGAEGACTEDYGMCDHLCLPTGTRRHVCACATGYILADDEKSCETEDPKWEEFLLVADSALNGIYQVDVSTDDHGIAALPMGALDFPVALAYDDVDGFVYWTDRSRSAIGRATLSGSFEDSELFGDIADPGGIALDTRRRIVYWTDEGSNVIETAGMDGNLGRRIFVGQDLDEPRAIAVNLRNGDVYWTDWGSAAKIERVSLDGSDRQVIAESGLVWPNCLAIDSIDDIMYWCDAHHDAIEASDLDGNGRRVLISFDGEAHPFALVVYGDFVYWTDWVKHRLSRADRWTGLGVEEVGEADFLRMQGLVAYQYPELLETTTYDEGLPSTVTLSPETVPPVNGALNVTLIAVAAGGGLALLVTICLVVCCVVMCARSKGGSGSDQHVPMSVRSTSFVGAYDPKGTPVLGGSGNLPPPLPPARTADQTEPIYQDINDYQTAIGGGMTADYQGYLNPVFKGDGGSATQTPFTSRYVSAGQPAQAPLAPPTNEAPPTNRAPPTNKAPPINKGPPTTAAPPTSKAPPTKKAPPTAAKPKPRLPKGPAPPRPDGAYMTPDPPAEQNYMDLRL